MKEPTFATCEPSLKICLTNSVLCMENGSKSKPLLIHIVWNTISPPLQSNVFMYYGLSNFYQNHRRYVKSRDDSQLNGDRSALTV